MDKEYFMKLVGKFPEKLPPLWPCSTCSKGFLEIIDESLRVKETGPSVAEHSHEAHDYDWVVMRFAGLLKCNNKLCGEIASIAGKAELEENPDWESQTIDYFRVLTPEFINPPPLFFTIPLECPGKIQKSIIRSFGLACTDLESSANAIRSTIEIILDDLKIQKIVRKGGRQSKLRLHDRIIKLQSSDSETGDLLLAIKWIGNSGSHIEALTHGDLFDTFEILEQALTRLYSTSTKRAKAKAAKIIKRKGPIK